RRGVQGRAHRRAGRLHRALDGAHARRHRGRRVRRRVVVQEEELNMRKLLPALLACVAACSHMQVPPELKSSEIPVAVTPGLFSGNFRFGPFRAMEISKGFIHGGGTSVSWLGVHHEEESNAQDYSFRYEE